MADLESIGPGGAPNQYLIEIPDKSLTQIKFQSGPTSEAGIDGWSNEALLAIVQDRLGCFQDGPFADGGNEDALHHVREALNLLHLRTENRQIRGVEDTLNP